MTQVDIERLPSYTLGMERGIEQGLVAGSDQERLRLARNLLDLLATT